jgi:hypothetical protein
LEIHPKKYNKLDNEKKIPSVIFGEPKAKEVQKSRQCKENSILAYLKDLRT